VAGCAPSDPECRAVDDANEQLKERASALGFPSSADRGFIRECGDIGGALGSRHLSDRTEADAMVACYRANCEVSTSGRYCSEKEDLLGDLVDLAIRNAQGHCSIEVSM
jgi:hypothetical protein